MRMCILVIRCAVRSPAGMPHAYMPGNVFVFKVILEIIDLTCYFIDIYFVCFRIKQSNTGAVIPPVFKSLKAFDKDRAGISVTYICYYSTHKLRFSAFFDICASMDRFTAPDTVWSWS